MQGNLLGIERDEEHIYAASADPLKAKVRHQQLLPGGQLASGKACAGELLVHAG